MKASEIIEKALESYAPMSFLCNIIEKKFGERNNDVVRTLNMINNRLGTHYTLTSWLSENDSMYNELCGIADPDCTKDNRGNSSKAMGSSQCYSHRVLYWRRLIEELKAIGD